MKKHRIRYVCGEGHLHRSGASAAKCGQPVRLVRVPKGEKSVENTPPTLARLHGENP